MKYCKKCDTDKPESEFSKHKGREDGLQHSCKSCARAYQIENADNISARTRQYYLDNKDTISVIRREHYEENKLAVSLYKRKYREEHKAEIAAKARKWAEDNKEAIAEKMREYSAANPEKVSANKRNYRSRKRAADGSHTSEEVKAIFDSQRGFCANCPAKLIKSGKNRYHVDHIQPLAKGGSNDKYNLQCLCRECNHRKHAKDPIDWARENGKLI